MTPAGFAVKVCPSHVSTCRPQPGRRDSAVGIPSPTVTSRATSGNGGSDARGSAPASPTTPTTTTPTTTTTTTPPPTTTTTTTPPPPPTTTTPLADSGSKDLRTTTIYKYTIHVTDLRTGTSLENHKALLRDQVIRDLPHHVHRMGNMSFVSGSEWRMAGSDVAGVVVFAELHDSSDASFQGKKSLEGFVKSGSGPRARWLKFEQTKFSASRPAHDGLQQLRDMASCSDGRRLFALTFDRRQSMLVPTGPHSSDGRDAQLSPHEVHHFLGSELKHHILRQPGFASAALEVRGDCVFGTTMTEACGIELRHGYRASLSLHGTPPAAQLVWTSLKPSTRGSEKTANFFKDHNVSNFLLDYFGATLSRVLNDAQVRQASTLLKGVRVTVAVRAADRPCVATIHSVGRTARDLPRCLHGTTVGEGTVERLRFPDLPCVNVGTEHKPFFYPAELCRMRENQSFSGPLPEPVRDDRFVPPPAVVRRSTRQHEAKNGDPFSAVKPSDFAITFVRLVDSGHVPVNDSAWQDFQHELGQRYQAKLAQSVLGAKHFSGHIDKLRERLMHRDYCNASVKTVIVVAAPASTRSAELDALKAFCAVKIGAQVQIVAAAEVRRRSQRDAANRSMVMYTGQVAKKIFARALLPGTPDEASKLATDLGVFQKRTPGARILGINVQSLQNEPPVDVLTGAKRTHLVTVVSATGKVAAVHTTTSLCTTGSEDRLSELLPAVEAAFKAHVAQHAKVPSTEAVVYISGLPRMSKARFDALGSTIHKLTPLTAPHKKDQHPKQQSCFTFVTMSRETQVTIPETDGFFAMAPLTQAEFNETTNNINVGHLVLAHNYRKPAGYMDAKGELRDATILWRALRRKALPGCAFKTEEVLMRAREPSILQLAALANKRAKGRVVKVDGQLEIAAVKEGLKGTLWYL